MPRVWQKVDPRRLFCESLLILIALLSPVVYIIGALETYPRGRRGRFAKPLVVVRPARVRIPPSPPANPNDDEILVVFLFSAKEKSRLLGSIVILGLESFDVGDIKVFRTVIGIQGDAFLAGKEGGLGFVEVGLDGEAGDGDLLFTIEVVAKANFAA